jgi:hypothetical protein
LGGVRFRLGRFLFPLSGLLLALLAISFRLRRSSTQGTLPFDKMNIFKNIANQFKRGRQNKEQESETHCFGRPAGLFFFPPPASFRLIISIKGVVTTAFCSP